MKKGNAVQVAADAGLPDVLYGERRGLHGHLQARRRPASGSAHPADHFADGSPAQTRKPRPEAHALSCPGHII